MSLNGINNESVGWLISKHTNKTFTFTFLKSVTARENQGEYLIRLKNQTPLQQSGSYNSTISFEYTSKNEMKRLILKDYF